MVTLVGDDKEVLYKVIVVSVNRDVILDSMVVARNADEAKLSLGLDTLLKHHNLTPRDVTIIVDSLGQVTVTCDKTKKSKVVQL